MCFESVEFFLTHGLRFNEKNGPRLIPQELLTIGIGIFCRGKTEAP